ERNVTFAATAAPASKRRREARARRTIRLNGRGREVIQCPTIARMLAAETPLGPYRLVAKIGAGGMGEVWKAEDTRLGRMVAIKILPPAVASDGDALARLKREARTAAQLYHPNIATIHSIEQDGDRFFIVMELVEGEPLSH